MLNLFPNEKNNYENWSCKMQQWWKTPNMNIFSHIIFYPMQIPKIIVFVAWTFLRHLDFIYTFFSRETFRKRYTIKALVITKHYRSTIHDICILLDQQYQFPFTSMPIAYKPYLICINWKQTLKMYFKLVN